jgi:DNA-binding LacI/PurR family transcriptional regulator
MKRSRNIVSVDKVRYRVKGPDEGTRPPRRVTLADVANRAGVSPALASIVVRGAPGASASSRQRVLAVAAELGYRPDVRARSLASLKPQLIGVLFGKAGRFHFDLLDGLYSAAETRGWDLVLSALTDDRDERRALQSLQDFHCDALVMLGPPVATPQMAGRMPLVVMGWHVDHPDVDIVRTSDDHGMALAVEHLVGLGHRRIAHLGGGSGVVAASRRDGYERAMRSHGLDGETRIVPCDGEDQLDGQRATRAMLEDPAGLPSALVAFNDDVAAAAMSVLALRGIRVPADVSIIGVDDGPLASSSSIDLTTVQQLPREMARLAVERIVARTAGSKVSSREIVLEPTLHIRSSTGPAASR